ncbi:MAG: hypothetical protein J5646_02660 [Bacteroidales bacterium]|nr:hypothetical protein [Bacteroidales bacterium]
MKAKIPLLGAVVLLLSCQNLVLENRIVCPSMLLFDIENADAFDGVNRVHIAAYSQTEEVFLTADTTIVDDIQDQSFYLKVKKLDAVKGYGVMGFEGARKQGIFQWVVDEGADYVPLFRFAYDKVPGREESVLIPVEFVKDFTRMTIRFTHFDQFRLAGGRLPFRMAITGNTVGIDASTGVPVKGAFRHEPEEEANGTFRFIVPRQADHSLTMELYGIPELGQAEGLVDAFNLWNLLREKTDFSWEDKNLADVYLEFDYTEAKFQISVAEWEKGDNLIFEI